LRKAKEAEGLKATCRLCRLVPSSARRKSIVSEGQCHQQVNSVRRLVTAAVCLRVLMMKELEG
jgi:hypothetical protein